MGFEPPGRDVSKLVRVKHKLPGARGGAGSGPC
jgi:hypothetical protein